MTQPTDKKDYGKDEVHRGLGRVWLLKWPDGYWRESPTPTADSAGNRPNLPPLLHW